MKARDLEGRVVLVPDELPTGSRVLIVAFQRWHQSLVDGWTTFLAHAEQRFPNMTVWEMPVLSRAYTPARPLIDGGMRSAVPEGHARRAILTVYTDVRGLQRKLEIASTETVQVLLLDGEGHVVWSESGPLDQARANGITAALAELEADSAEDA